MQEVDAGEDALAGVEEYDSNDGGRAAGGDDTGGCGPPDSTCAKRWKAYTCSVFPKYDGRALFCFPTTPAPTPSTVFGV